MHRLAFLGLLLVSLPACSDGPVTIIDARRDAGADGGMPDVDAGVDQGTTDGGCVPPPLPYVPRDTGGSATETPTACIGRVGPVPRR